MIIGIQPRPTKSRDWAKIRAYLEPAAKLGGVPILEKHEVVWTAYEGGELYGAATARILPEEKIGEIVLVGGRDRKKWIIELNRLLGEWFTLEGMQSMRAYGRIGWRRELEALGWRVIGVKGKEMGFERVLT